MLSLSLSILALSGAVIAQTPPGFAPNVTNHLEVKFGAKVVTPGLLVTKTGEVLKIQA